MGEEEKMGKFLPAVALAFALLAGCQGAAKRNPDQQKQAVKLIEEGRTLQDEGQVFVALDKFTKAIEACPDLDAAYDYRARLNEQLGNYDQAERDYSTAIRFAPNEAVYYNDRGEFYKRQKRYQEAERDINKAIALDDSVPQLYVNRALLYYDCGKYREAQKDFELVLQFSPKPNLREQIEHYLGEIKNRIKMQQEER